jgi:hypothetical protein
MTSPAKKPPPPSNLVSPTVLAGLGKLPVPHGNSPVGAPGLRNVAQKLMPPGFGTAQPSVTEFLRDLREGGDVREKIRAFLQTKAEKRKEARARVSKLKGLSLTYSPTNVEVYVQAYDGAFAGMTTGRLLLSSDQTTYLEQSLAAGVWAQQFDTLWNDGGALDEVQAEIILLGSSAVWQGRFANTLTADQTSSSILALVAAIEETELFFSEQGISPPLWNSGSGGGEVVPKGNLLASPYTAPSGISSGAVMSLTAANAVINFPPSPFDGQVVTVGFVGTENGFLGQWVSTTANILATGYSGPQSTVMAGQVGGSATFSFAGATSQWLRIG